MPRFAWLALAAVALYGLDNAVIDKYLKNINPLLTVMTRSFGITLLLALYFNLSKNNAPFGGSGPTMKSEWIALIAVCSAGMLADILFFAAFKSAAEINGAGITISIMIILVPVFTSLMNLLIGAPHPTLRQTVAWVVIGIGLTIMFTGKEPPSPSSVDDMHINE